MSGHSKWSSIKHKKAAEDAKRGAIFGKLSRAVTVAAREGGGNPEMNAALETAIQKAKDNNMPADNISRAIKKGTGDLEGAQYETVVYEGYGAGGVALMVETMTDNRNRTAADIRHTFSKYAGSLGGAGSVAWMFERKGDILIPKDAVSGEDELLEIVLDAGAEDVISGDDVWEIVTSFESFMDVRRALEDKEIPIASAAVTMLPKNAVELGRTEAQKILRLVDALEEHDDVQEVYANFDIPDEILEEIAGQTP